MSTVTVTIVIATAAATASRVDWGWTMLVTWVF
jgi:hypothetical protein